MNVVVALLPVAVVAALLVVVWRTAASPGPLSDVTRSGDDVVVTVHAPVWLAFRRRLAAPVSSVTAARVVPPKAHIGLVLRVCGTGWPGMALGWFWGGGWCFVVRRRRREAIEITFGDGRVRRWVVETTAPADVARDLSTAVR